MSLILRHDPGSAGLVLDEDGFVSIPQLLAALARVQGMPPLSREDLVDIERTGSKPRFEIKGDRIRARWGHSVTDRVDQPAATPPEFLFHETSRRALPAIRSEGLVPMSRQYVHMSPDDETATNVGQRHDRSCVILRVQAGRAARDGIVFYSSHSMIWLADRVPAAYLEFPDETAA